MQTMLGARIGVTPRPAGREVPLFDVALLGHCPGKVRIERLLALREPLIALESLGYRQSVRTLRDGGRKDLDHLPLLLRSAAEFHDVFPQAATSPTRYHSELAGDRAWLARAVDDFFANGGGRLWVIPVPDAGDDARSHFMPRPDTRLEQAEALRGFEVALAIPTLAAVALPDLERMQIPEDLPDIARVRLENPRPGFRPCSQSLDDGHRERRHPEEMPQANPTWPLSRMLGPVLEALSRQRPDVQLLLSLPMAGTTTRGQPTVDPGALRTLTNAARAGSAPALRHVQFLFPYLRAADIGLHSPVGAVAALQARVTRDRGPWVSIAERAMRTDAMPWPALAHGEILALREDPGVGVLCGRGGQVVLDDERLVVPALLGSGRGKAHRSGELRRFMGYLRRQLQMLGEAMVFDTDPGDPRPGVLLQGFLRKLHARGALRGALPEDAFRLARSNPGEGQLRFDIEIAPAFPIDRLWLSFVHRDGRWESEVADV
jgi:hypothetical protein